MKTITQTIMLLAVASILPAYSQSPPRLKADVPFAFRVGDKVLNDGTYILQNVEQGLTLIRSEDRNGGAFTITALETRQTVEPRLIFHRFDNSYFLSQIWTGSTGGEVPMSRTERWINAEGPAPGIVVLALAK
jgi:hypothetical protein